MMKKSFAFIDSKTFLKSKLCHVLCKAELNIKNTRKFFFTISERKFYNFGLGIKKTSADMRCLTLANHYRTTSISPSNIKQIILNKKIFRHLNI